MKVKFKVTSLAGHRATNSSLEIDNIYEGDYKMSNNSVQWTDPKNAQEWSFWVGDTCELVLVDNQELIKKIYQEARERMKNIGVITTSIEDVFI